MSRTKHGFVMVSIAILFVFLTIAFISINSIIRKSSALSSMLQVMSGDVIQGLIIIGAFLVLWILGQAFLKHFSSNPGPADSFFQGVPNAPAYQALVPLRRISSSESVPYSVEHAIVQETIETRRLPRVYPTSKSVTPQSTIMITSGFDEAGEYFKLGIKIKNRGQFPIEDVVVELDIPDGFKFVRDTDNSQTLGTIQPRGSQSAIFWLQPLRCVDGKYSGRVKYYDSRGMPRVVKIPPKRLVNICPMLTSTERADEVFARLKAGALSRNCSSFEFVGLPQVVFHMAEARLSSLVPVDHSEYEGPDSIYLGYACYVGQTKYGETMFAAEIQVSGSKQSGILTVTVYAEDRSILSGFFVDIMYDIRRHIEILKERMCPIATCSKCGGPLNLSNVGPDRIFRCEYCGTMGKLAPWLAYS